MSSEHLHDTKETETLAGDWQGFCTEIAKFNEYATAADPGYVLRKGLLEEVRELRIEQTLEQGEDKPNTTGEVGDLLYYLAHINAHSGNSQPLDIDNPKKLPFYTHDGSPYDMDDTTPDSVIANVLRVCDSENPYMHFLWHGRLQAGDTTQITGLLESTLAAVRLFAEQNNIELREAMTVTAEKLESRSRAAHVIVDEAQKSKNKRPARPLVNGRLGALATMSPKIHDALGVSESDLIEAYEKV